MAAVLVQATLFLGLWLGLVVAPGLRIEEQSMAYVEPIEVPPPPPERRPARAVRPKGASSAPAPVARATPIVVPPPVIPPVIVPPIVAAEVAGTETAADAGAAVEGPGAARGGAGVGQGVGDAGAGDGGGGVPAEWIRGRITDRDYPYEAIRNGLQGRLVARYVIGINGKVTSCTVVESSGNAVLDGTTCRLVEHRFRYRPARDAAGRKVVDVIEEEHAWVIERGGDAPR